MCPTSPDTLRSFPFVSEDPFVLDDAPHVYFAGNQPRYETELIEDDGTTRLICVPSFRKSKSIVLLDLTTLQTYEYKFDCSCLVNMPPTDELEFNPNC
jgi:DNA polymerase delta subunit 2